MKFSVTMWSELLPSSLMAGFQTSTFPRTIWSLKFACEPMVRSSVSPSAGVRNVLQSEDWLK
jgi:hypothetical protein